ncbi:MAG TPA: VWA domain-containing protein [Chloroflexi bacterium]|nr:VWA domain-containing protein [Chloroflexota bacterium]
MRKEDFKPDYYEILEVSPFATQEEIKKAYKRLVKKYHPDVNRAAGTAYLFRRLQEAYEVLSDPQQRQKYDEWLKAQGSYPETPLWMEVITSHRVLPSLPEPQAWYVLIKLRVEPRAIPADRALNICLVIDRSTSMKGLGIEKAVEAAEVVLENLREGDVISVVSFNDRAQVMLPASKKLNHREARKKLRSIKAEGGTEMARGISAGLSELMKAGIFRTINHMILLTDGNTYGDEEECIRLAEEAGRRGIPITAVGMGTAWNEELLDAIATKSGGVSLFVIYPNLLPSAFLERVKALRSAIASSLRGEFRVMNGVKVKGLFRLHPGVERLSPDRAPVYIGPVRDSIQLFMELTIPPLPPGEYEIASWELSEPQGLYRLNGRASLKLAEGAEAGEAPAEILQAAEKVAVFKLREKVWDEMKQGERERASHRLKMLAARLAEMGETELSAIAGTEALKLAQTGRLSPEGQKRILYGTRFLALLPPEEKG